MGRKENIGTFSTSHTSSKTRGSRNKARDDDDFIMDRDSDRDGLTPTPSTPKAHPTERHKPRPRNATRTRATTRLVAQCNALFRWQGGRRSGRPVG